MKWTDKNGLKNTSDLFFELVEVISYAMQARGVIGSTRSISYDIVDALAHSDLAPWLELRRALADQVERDRNGE